MKPWYDETRPEAPAIDEELRLIKVFNRVVIGVLLLALALAGSCSVAFAAETEIYPGGVSYHWKTMTDGRKFNDHNVGLLGGVAFDETRAVFGGVYRNSEWRTSAVLGYRYTPLGVGPLRIGALVGAVTGYQSAPVLPMAAIVVAWRPLPHVVVSAVVSPQVPALDHRGHASVLIGWRW